MSFTKYTTDLALERCLADSSLTEGIKMRKSGNEEVDITHITVLTDSAAERLGKPVGEYYTLEMTCFSDDAPLSEKRIEAINSVITKLLPRKGTVLVAGIGNSEMTSDALGPMTASAIFATRHISANLRRQLGFGGELRSVAAVSTGVLGKTGIETGEYIKCVCSAVRPAAVITVDALAASELSRLGTTVQICNTGISPGSGVGNCRKRIDETLLGVPVIAVGVPTVANLGGRGGGESSDFVVTPKDVDSLVKNAASLLAFSINSALQPALSAQDIYSLS